MSYIVLLGLVACTKPCACVHEQETGINRALIFRQKHEYHYATEVCKKTFTDEFGPVESDKYKLRDYVIGSRFAENYNGVYSI